MKYVLLYRFYGANVTQPQQIYTLLHASRLWQEDSEDTVPLKWLVHSSPQRRLHCAVMAQRLAAGFRSVSCYPAAVRWSRTRAAPQIEAEQQHILASSLNLFGKDFSFFFFWIRARTQNSYVHTVPTLFSHLQYKRKQSYAGEHKPHVTPLSAGQHGRRQSKGSTRRREMNMKLWAVSCVTQPGEKNKIPHE